MKQTNRLPVDVGLSPLSGRSLPWRPGTQRLRRWAPFAWAPLLAVALATGGALLLRSRSADRAAPVSVDRSPPAETLPAAALPSTTAAPTTTEGGKPGILRVEAPPTIIEVNVKR